MPKFHKHPVGSRFIAASGQCTTATLSKALSHCLTHVLRTLREKDNDTILSTGVRRYFVVETYEEVSGFLSRWRRSERGQTGLYTGDFSTMYTTIPHDKLFQAIERSTREAFDYAGDRKNIDGKAMGLSLVGSVCTWVRANRSVHEKSGHTFTWVELNSLVRFLVSNTFVTCGNTIFKQLVGIPMGTNCAPVLANLFLYAYESAYITRVENEKGREAARQFQMTFRLIDDVLSADNTHISDAVQVCSENGGMYPSELTLNTTSVSPQEAEFLGMRILADTRRFRISVFDKRKSFPFAVRKYPLMSSLIPRTMLLGVFVGLLHRGYRICSGADDFLDYALDVALTLLDNGGSRQKLRRVFESFVNEHVRKYHGTRGTALSKSFYSRLH